MLLSILAYRFTVNFDFSFKISVFGLIAWIWLHEPNINDSKRHPDHINFPQENNTFDDLLGYPFGPISRLDDDHVEYDNHHDSRIKLINNATFQNENTTKKVWAIYDMTAVHIRKNRNLRL